MSPFYSGGIFVWEEFCRGWNFCLGGIWVQDEFYLPRFFGRRLFCRAAYFFRQVGNKRGGNVPLCRCLSFSPARLCSCAAAYPFSPARLFSCASPFAPCLLAAFRLLFACFFCAKKRRKKSKFSCFCATFSPSYKKKPFWVKKLKKIAKKSHIFPVIS